MDQLNKGNEMEFKLEDAIQALHSVCRQFKGTADDHDYLKFCINEIYKRLKPSDSAPSPVDPKDHIKPYPVPVPNAEG
jgi:hypothetical protein